MKDWWLERAKAVVGFLIPGVITAAIKALEMGFGFDLSVENETFIIMAVTSLLVYQVPNKS
jgi:hypothetical protein